MSVNHKYYQRINDNDEYRRSRIKDSDTVHHELVETNIIFDPPKKDFVLDVLDVANGVGLLSAKVKGDDFVSIKGYIYKSVMYTTAKKEDVDKLNEFKNKSMDSLEDEDMDDREERRYYDYMNGIDDESGGLYRGHNVRERDGKGEREERDNREEKDDKGEREERHNREEKDDKGERNNREGREEKNNKDGRDKEEGKDNNEKKNKNKYEEDKGKSEVVKIDGVVRHMTLCIPFESSVHVEGARYGDRPYCELEFVRNTEGSNIIVGEEKVMGVKEIDVVKLNIRLNK